MNELPLSRSDALIAAMHKAALRALAAAPGGQLKARALKQAIEATVPLDDWARETYATTGHTRWRSTRWRSILASLGLVQSSGKTQATRYFVAPALLKGSGLDGKTTLRRMEPHRLRALIVEDLARYPDSSSGDINRRVGPEVPYRSLKRALDELTAKGQIQHEGLARGRRYRLRQD